MHHPAGFLGQSHSERAATRAALDAWMGDALTCVQGMLAAYVQAELFARASLAARAGDMPAEALVLANLSKRALASAGKGVDPETHERVQALASAFVVQSLAAMHPPPPQRVLRAPARGERVLPFR